MGTKTWCDMCGTPKMLVLLRVTYTDKSRCNAGLGAAYYDVCSACYRDILAQLKAKAEALDV